MTDTQLENMVDEVVEDAPTSMNDGPQRPAVTDPKWVDYVVDQLADHELIEGAPTTDGLRRVCEKVYGEILESDTEILEIPAKAYVGKVTAKHTLVIAKYGSEALIRVTACIDVLGENLPAPFNKHLVASACTKAEGKALRRAMKIRVQTHEELAGNADDEKINTDSPINDQQIVAIKAMCKRNDVDLIKFVKQNSDDPKTIRDVKNLEGRLMINKLSGYQREGTPDDMARYNDNWEEEFGGKG